MLDTKLDTLLAVAETKNFTKAGELLSLTQPAVSHHISLLEQELGVRLFVRGKGDIRPTPEGEATIRYAKRFKAIYQKLQQELSDSQRNLTRLRIGLTHTAESNIISEVLAKYSNQNSGVSITLLTDTIKNLYEKLENYELDLAVSNGRAHNPDLCSLMLDTDYLVCVMSNNNPLSDHSMVTLNELKRERMILRLPTSSTRMLFESTLESLGESIHSYEVILEVDNIATIKDLIRKDLGISILAKSACMDDLRKGKLTALPIENLSMVRETNLVYHRDFAHTEVLRELTRLYQETVRHYD